MGIVTTAMAGLTAIRWRSWLWLQALLLSP